jgi:hypothetical protein
MTQHKKAVATTLTAEGVPFDDLIVWRKCSGDIGVEFTSEDVRYYATYSESPVGTIHHLYTYKSDGETNKHVLTVLETM